MCGPEGAPLPSARCAGRRPARALRPYSTATSSRRHARRSSRRRAHRSQRRLSSAGRSAAAAASSESAAPRQPLQTQTNQSRRTLPLLDWKHLPTPMFRSRKRVGPVKPGGEEDGRRRSMVESVRSPAAVPRRMRSEGWGTNPRPSKWRGREARDRVQADPPRRMQSDGPDAGGGCGLPQVRGAIAGGGAAAAEVKLLGLVAALSRDREPGEVSGVGGGAAPKGASLVGTSGSSVQSRGPSSKEPMRRGGAATSAAEQLDANNGFVQLPSPAHRRDFEASATVADSISQWSTNLIQVDGKDKNSNSEGNGCSNGSRGQHVTFAVTPWSSLADKRVSGCAPPILNHGGSKLEPEPGGPPVPGVPVLREPVFSSAAAGTGSGSRLRRVPGLDSSGVRRSRSDVGPAIPERPW